MRARAHFYISNARLPLFGLLYVCIDSCLTSGMKSNVHEKQTNKHKILQFAGICLLWPHRCMTLIHNVQLANLLNLLKCNNSVWMCKTQDGSAPYPQPLWWWLMITVGITFGDSHNFKKSQEFSNRLPLFEEMVWNVMVAQNKLGKNIQSWYLAFEHVNISKLYKAPLLNSNLTPLPVCQENSSTGLLSHHCSQQPEFLHWCCGKNRSVELWRQQRNRSYLRLLAW